MPEIIIDKFVKSINSFIEKIEVDFRRREVRINDMRFHPVNLFEEKEIIERFKDLNEKEEVI